MTIDPAAFDAFDARLAARLARLEAAIPAPRLPTITGSTIDVLRRPTARPRRRWRLPALLAAAALLVTAGLVGAERSLYPDVQEPRLEAALAEIFAGSGCLPAADVTPQIEARLADLGYDGWTVAPRPGAATAPCVLPGVVSPLHEVALFPTGGKKLADALQQVAGVLEDQCLNRAQAFSLVSSTVKSIGTVPDFNISADPWGPQGGPIDKIQFYEEHVHAGCFVYAGMGGDANGKAEFYLWGPWP
jgi:hypothetical protein